MGHITSGHIKQLRMSLPRDPLQLLSWAKIEELSEILLPEIPKALTVSNTDLMITHYAHRWGLINMYGS